MEKTSRRVIRGDEMGYRIEYGSDRDKITEKPKNRTVRKILIGLCLLLFSLGVKENWPDGAKMLCSAFLPGEPDKTQLAAADFLEHLGQGVDFGEAFRTFCLEVLEDADPA